ncbi:MFSD8 protein, partial [Amia calva]|nr:MFSD8 protein [Amia calva]
FSPLSPAVILPTIWRYLQTLDAEPYFLGLGLSAFSLSGLLCGPLFGHWSDRTRKTKAIILFANIFEIAGNFMYFMGYSKWLLLSSRLVAGIGTGAGASIFGYLTRSTAPEDRATVFAAVMACRQAGLLIGPAFNLFLRLCNFHIGPFVVNKYTSPGLFMCFLWVLLELVVLFMYWDIMPQRGPHVSGTEDELEEEGEEGEAKPLVTPTSLECYGSVGPGQPEFEGHSLANGTLSPPSPPPSPPPSAQSSGFSPSKEYLREEVVVLLTAQFITLFNQTALEKFFNFGELENSIMYCLCGVEVIAGFFFVRWLSQHCADRVILAVGLIICNVSCVWCLIFLANPLGGLPWQLAEFIIGVFLQVLGLPFVAVSQVSLFSKVTAEKTQGFSQGLRRSVGGLATILGPLWAGGLTNNLYIMLGVMMALLTLLTVSMPDPRTPLRHAQPIATSVSVCEPGISVFTEAAHASESFLYHSLEL